MKTSFSVTLLLISILLLGSCAQSPKPIKKQPISTQSIPAIEQGQSIQYLLQQAKGAQTEKAIILLILAGEKYIQKQQYTAALWLAQQTLAITNNNTEQYRLNVIKAQSLLALQQYDLALSAIKTAAIIAEQHQITRLLSDYQTLANIQTARGLLAKALIAKLHAFALNSTASEENILQLWQDFSQLSAWQQSIIKSAKPPYGQGWLALISYANHYGDNIERFQRYLLTWQRQFPNHPANQIIAYIVQSTQQLVAPAISTVTVMLPLTGKQQAAGLAAQQGLLAAYANNKTQVINFIDTNTLDWQTLEEILITSNTDFVIGPLLKQNVEQYLALELSALPTLLLNIPDNTTLKAQQFAISMRPEDEAIQAADVLSQKSYQHPMLLSNNDALSRRIAQSFIKQWQKNTGKSPEVYFINPGKRMQKDVQASLDVDLSKDRIKKLKSRLKPTIKAEARNRRDIDMIYLVSNAKLTRLLKPYIDVNISPFADLVPIYASSRSHSVRAEKQAMRDLSGLTFSELPFLLASQEQNKQLAQLHKKLWPQRSDSLQSIFALGFDSFFLMNKVSLMKKAPYIHHFGQTGILKLNRNNILSRTLIWGKYRANRVRAIAM